MQNKDNKKRKNEMFHSIMSNPKLARTFKEAMNSPIGSTKREQAKSILSIMKKVGGVNSNDGQGGPTPTTSTPYQAPTFNNLMVFPALPNFKTTSTSTTPSKETSLVMPNMNSFNSPSLKTISPSLSNISPFLKTNQPTTTLPTTKPVEIDYAQLVKDNPINPGWKQVLSPSNLWGGLKTLLKPAYTAARVVGDIGASIPGAAIGAVSAGLSPIEAGVRTVVNPTFWKNLWNGTNPGDPSGVVSPADTTAWKLAKGFTVDSPWIKDLASMMGNKTATTPTPTTTPTVTTTGTPPVTTTETTTGTPPATDTYSGTPSVLGTDTSSASGSVTYPSTGSGTSYGTVPGSSSALPGMNGQGATAYAMDYADAKFGGGLDQYITNLDAKLKKDFNLEPLEQELSDLKSQGTNLVPTMQNYIRGKDQYLKFIDEMVAKTEDSRLSQDMGNPANAAQFNNNLSYLYTLKGRQNTRYGNFLNSAVADYNADLTRMQSNYDNVYKDYSDAINRQGTMAQNEYNNLLTRMSAAYTEMENAPIKALNLKILQDQAYGVNSSTLGIAGDSTTLNADYYKDKDLFTKQYLTEDRTTSTTNDPNGYSLDMSKIGTEGLTGVYNEALRTGHDIVALTNVLSIGLKKSLANASSVDEVNKIKQYITDLANSGDTVEAQTQYGIWGSTLYNQVFSGGSNAMQSVVADKLPTIKTAVNDLINPYGGFLGMGKTESGLTDKTTWMKKYATTLTQSLADALYNSISLEAKNRIAAGQKASTIYEDLFSGTDTQNISAISSSISNAPIY